MQTNEHAQTQCRICFLTNEPLISPCKCRGSMLHAHNECLVRWFCSKNDIVRVATEQKECFLQCEVCKYQMSAIPHRNSGTFRFLLARCITIFLFSILILLCGVGGMALGKQVAEHTYTGMQFVTPLFDKLTNYFEKFFGLLLEDIFAEQVCFKIRTQWTGEITNNSYVIFKNTPKQCDLVETMYCDDLESYSCTKQVVQNILNKTREDHHTRLQTFWQDRIHVKWSDPYAMLDVILSGLVLACCTTSLLQYLREYDFYIPQLLSCATLILFLKDFTVIPAVPLDSIPSHFCITLIWSYLLNMGPCAWIRYFYIGFTAIVTSTACFVLFLHARTVNRRLFLAFMQNDVKSAWRRLFHETTLKEREQDLASFVTLEFKSLNF